LHSNIETRVGIFVLGALGIFIYMGFSIGVFRFDRGNYYGYTIGFQDISGLVRKAEVKIAGVKVGWVEDIILQPESYQKAQARIMVHKNYRLYENAYGMVKQDGLLGPKYIELVPGDPGLSKLEPGVMLKEPSQEPVSIDGILREFRTIAHNVKDVSAAFNNALGGDIGSERLRGLVEHLTVAASHIANVSQVLERSFVNNEEHLSTLLQLGSTINRVVDKLETDILPGFNASINNIASVFDRDFGRIATNVEVVSNTIDEAAGEARDGFHTLGNVATKIDEGQGVVGKLINEDEIYRDIKIAANGIRKYINKLDQLQIVIDAHSESMITPAENYFWEDNKGYFEARIFPQEDYFFVVQYMQSEKGFLDRTEQQVNYTFRKENFVESAEDNAEYSHQYPVNVYPNTLFTPQSNVGNGFKLLDLAGVREERISFFRDMGRLGVQFGKIFGDFALRAGIIEGFVGLGVDIDIPFRTDKFRWVSTFEAFDMNGRNRIDDRRPHLKWLNRMYFMRNLYFTFGADDFISKHNKSIFYGVGFRFGDDDLKYVMSSVGGALGSLGR
jgi:phospholipid/cholesterol/gamma-HCH transport system substrate-binding protein